MVGIAAVTTWLAEARSQLAKSPSLASVCPTTNDNNDSCLDFLAFSTACRCSCSGFGVMITPAVLVVLFCATLFPALSVEGGGRKYVGSRNELRVILVTSSQL